MLKSLRGKMFLIFSAVILALIVFMFVLNSILLPQYYLYRYEEKLKRCYIEIAETITAQNPVRSLKYDLDVMQSKNGVRIIITDMLSNFVYGNENVGMFSLGDETITEKPGFTFWDLPSTITSDETRITTRYDSGADLKFIGILGRVFITSGDIDEFYYVSVDATMEAINDNINTSNTFLLYSGLIILIVGGISAFFVSSRFVKPIEKVSRAAQKMAVLDFSDKVEVKSRDEVGQLALNINSLSTQLEHTISELQTANRQLQLDLETRIKSDNMRKEFISNVSHELKTPISLIMGYSEGLKVGINEEERDFYCDVITDEAQKMSKMVSRLLYVSKIDSDAMKPEMSRFVLSSLVDKYLENVSISLNDKQISVDKHYEYDGEICADSDQILQVVTNYINNAINHCGGEMKISLSITKSEDGRVRFSVFNTGEHIPEQSLTHIWESFYKVDSARTREYGGTGLGLYIVRRIIENHHGEYGVENVENGVVFYFELN